MSQALIQTILQKAVQEAVNAPDTNSRCGVLRYGPLMKWVGWICTVLFLGMSVGFGLTAPAEERLVAAVCFGFFVLLGIVLLVEGHWVRITYDEDGIRNTVTLAAGKAHRLVRGDIV